MRIEGAKEELKKEGKKRNKSLEFKIDDHENGFFKHFFANISH